MISLRLPPAKKVFLAEVITTPVMVAFSASRRSFTLVTDSTHAAFMVLAEPAGSSMVSTTIPSGSTSQRKVPIISEAVTTSPLQLMKHHKACGWGSDPLDDGRDAHAAADAHGDQAVALVAAVQFVDDRADEHGAGGAQRVTQSDGAAVDVDLLLDLRRGQAHVLAEAQDDRGERLVHLEQVDVIDSQTGLQQRLAGGRRRAGEHDRRVRAADRGGHDAG